MLYAGNVGDGQGLHLIIPKIDATFGPKVKFLIVGDGGKLTLLKSLLVKHKKRQLNS